VAKWSCLCPQSAQLSRPIISIERCSRPYAQRPHRGYRARPGDCSLDEHDENSKNVFDSSRIHGCHRTGAVAIPSVAKADIVIRAEEHAEVSASWREGVSAYSLEIEPHFTFGPDNVYGSSGFGGGMRMGIPFIVGRLGDVPTNLAIDFGADVIHYENCYYSGICGANYLMVPVAAQWNLFVVRRVSVFAEGGAYLYKGWFDGCGPDAGPDCASPSDFGILPTLALGGRLHLGSSTALTLRLGYPATTLGISFL